MNDKARSKAEFRAMREMLGLSQNDVARLLGIDVENVKRWERPGEAPPRPFAWELVDELEVRQEAAVDEAVRVVERMQEENGALPESVQLTYYRSQEQYDAMGRDEGPFGMANANARLVAWKLGGMGVNVEWAYPDDEGNVYHGRLR